MMLSKEEIKWFKDLQSHLNKAPSSLIEKSRLGDISSFTIGDDVITVYDQKKCSKYEDSMREPDDKCICVQESDSEILTIKFPFDVESTAG